MGNHGTDFSTWLLLLEERSKAMRENWVNKYATYQGKFVKFSEMISNPKPIHKPPPPLMLEAPFHLGLDEQ
tara:strand:+ start:3342 stop:3554 length:213 start_codon:yes stop_codon:yes gene_type:complete